MNTCVYYIVVFDRFCDRSFLFFFVHSLPVHNFWTVCVQWSRPIYKLHPQWIWCCLLLFFLSEDMFFYYSSYFLYVFIAISVSIILYMSKHIEEYVFVQNLILQGWMIRLCVRLWEHNHDSNNNNLIAASSIKTNIEYRLMAIRLIISHLVCFVNTFESLIPSRIFIQSSACQNKKMSLPQLCCVHKAQWNHFINMK